MIKKNKKSKMTIDQLAILMKAGFGRVDKKFNHLEEFIKEQIDELAISTARGFEGVEKRLTDRIDAIDIKIDTKIEEVKNKIEGVNKRIDDVAGNRVKYEDHNVLKKRVEVLEKV